MQVKGIYLSAPNIQIAANPIKNSEILDRVENNNASLLHDSHYRDQCRLFQNNFNTILLIMILQ